MYRVRPEFAKNGWVLHHDNAPAHSLKVQQFLTSRNITTLPHPPHSPDLASLDFWLFPKLKEPTKGHRYEDLEDIQRAVTTALKSLTSGDFQRWEERWTKCVRLGGEYCEVIPEQRRQSFRNIKKQQDISIQFPLIFIHLSREYKYSIIILTLEVFMYHYIPLIFEIIVTCVGVPLPMEWVLVEE